MVPDFAQTLLLEVFQTAVAAARPETALAHALPTLPPERVRILAAGKASIPMARVAAEAYPEAPGLLISHVPCPDPPAGFQVFHASHPVPDENSQGGGEAALQMAHHLGKDQTLIVALSGGASSLMAVPLPPLTIGDKADLTRTLLASGLDIHAMNTVRRHVSALKGGRLAATAWPARCLTFAVSDVVGDRPEDIASGPTVADPTTRQEARSLLDALPGKVPDAVYRALATPEAESVKPGDPRLGRSDHQTIVSAGLMMAAARAFLKARGVHVVEWGVGITGDAEDVARDHAARLATIVPGDAPIAVLSGGELTVRSTGLPGSGGPNQHYLLALAQALEGRDGLHALACDTDGRDGTAVDGTDHAGALITPETLSRARHLGLDPQRILATQDSGHLFKALDQAVVTGPTGTNVNDFRCILLTPPSTDHRGA